MKQALAQLGAAQRAQQRRAPPAARPSARKAHGGVQALDRNGECVRATLLFARWQRCGMGRISLMNGCACGIDAAIEIGGLDAMILDHLLQRFAHRPGLLPVLQAALAQADAGCPPGIKDQRSADHDAEEGEDEKAALRIGGKSVD